MIVVLSIIAGLSGLGLSALHEITKLPIEEQIIEYEIKPAILKLFKDQFEKNPEYEEDSDKPEYVFGEYNPVEEREKYRYKVEGEDTKKTIFPIRAKSDGKLYAVAFESYGVGYGGPVGVLVSFYANKDGLLAGIGITSNKETKGIGSRVTEPAFTEQFRDIKFESARLDSGIDAVAGATVSSVAVDTAIGNALAFWKEHKDNIIDLFKKSDKEKE